MIDPGPNPNRDFPGDYRNVHRHEGRSLFRAKAMQHYARSREKRVVPKFLSLRVVPYFWILISLLLVGLVITSMIEVPVYTSALGLVIDGNRFPEVDDQVVLAVFVPSEGHADLHEGQDVLVRFFRDGTRVRQTIVAVMPDVISPAMAHQRLDLPDGLAALIDRPAHMAIVRVQPIPDKYLPLAEVERAYRVDLRAGSLRLITLLPGIGSLFQD